MRRPLVDYDHVVDDLMHIARVLLQSIDEPFKYFHDLVFFKSCKLWHLHHFLLDQCE